MSGPIGNFRSRPDNTPRKPVEESEPSMPDDPVAPVVAQETEPEKKDLTPAELYRERLEEAEITMDEAMAIYDAVLTKGYYEEYVRLPGNNRAVFRTRSYEDVIRLQTILEMQKPTLTVTQQDLIARYNMAASLYEWKGRALPHNKEEDFEKVLELLRKMPSPVFEMLRQSLAKFDLKVLTIFSDGAAENF